MLQNSTNHLPFLKKCDEVLFTDTKTLRPLEQARIAERLNVPVERGTAGELALDDAGGM